MPRGEIPTHTIERTTHTLVCPACGQTVQAVALDGIIRGQCAVARKMVLLKVR